MHRKAQLAALACLSVACAVLFARTGPRAAHVVSLAGFPACAIPPCPQGQDQNETDRLAKLVRGLKSRWVEAWGRDFSSMVLLLRKCTVGHV